MAHEGHAGQAEVEIGGPAACHEMSALDPATVIARVMDTQVDSCLRKAVVGAQRGVVLAFDASGRRQPPSGSSSRRSRRWPSNTVRISITRLPGR